MSVKWHIILNFFEEIGGFSREEFFNGWKETGVCVDKNPHFFRTQLHKNLKEEGVYKFVNYAHFDSDEFVGFRHELADPKWIEQMKKGQQQGVLAYPGGFFEIATFDGKPIAPALPDCDSSIFLISPYEVGTGVDTSNLEKTWKEWSGADKMAAKDSEYGFKNAGLYKRFTDHGKFMYVVRAELTGLSANLPKGWELVESVRGIKLPDGVTRGDTSLYQVIPESIMEK